MTIADEPPPLSEVFSKMSWPQKLAVGATLIAVIGGSIGIMNQLAIAEPIWFATRGFVRTEIANANNKVETRQIATQIYLANSEYSRIQNELANKQVLLDQNPTMPQAIKDSIAEQVRSLNRSLETTKYQLDELRKEQANRRP